MDSSLFLIEDMGKYKYYKCWNYDWYNTDQFKVGDDPTDENFVLAIGEDRDYWIKLKGDKTFRRVKTTGGGSYCSMDKTSSYGLTWATEKKWLEKDQIGRYYKKGDKVMIQNSIFHFDFMEPTNEYDLESAPKIDFPQDVYWCTRLLKRKEGSGYLIIYDQTYYDPIDFEDPKLWILDGAVELDIDCSRVTKEYKVENYSTYRDGGTMVIDLLDPTTGQTLGIISPNRLGGKDEENGTATLNGEEVFWRLRQGDPDYFSLLKKIEKVLGIRIYDEEEYYDDQQRKRRAGL